VAGLVPLLPQARYLIVHGDAHGDVPATADARVRLPAELAAAEPARVRHVQSRELVREPLEVMRQLLGFLGLERRLDYEWALKMLNLTVPSAYPSPNRTSAGSPELPGDDPVGGARYVS